MATPKVSLVILTMQSLPKVLINDLNNQIFKDFEVIKASERGIVNAMNTALKYAQGEIFVRIDDDVRLPPQWLYELIKPFEDMNIAGVTGPTFVKQDKRGNRDSIRFAENPNWFLRWMFDNREFMPAAIYDSGCVSYDSNFMEKFCFPLNGYDPDHLEGTNWAMRTELIKMVGGFDPKFDGVAEWFDTDVEKKVKQFGYEFRYRCEAYLYHELGKGDHHADRFEGIGRLKNWLRFHIRHSKFHYKKVIWFLTMCMYFLWKGIKR